MNELEAKVLAPTTTAHRLLDLVVNMSSANVDAPRQIPSALEQKLHLIAKQNDGPGAPARTAFRPVDALRLPARVPVPADC